jgi:peptidoglycan/LPS O-acetylase OafA/YrhL
MIANRNLALDLVRGLCAVAVTAYHFTGWNYGIWHESAGAFGVYTFFTLSGIAMMMAHGRDFSTSIEFPKLQEFYVKRVARIIPLLAIVSFAYASHSLWSGTIASENWARALLTSTTAFSLSVPGFLSNATGAWSLGIEVIFYLLFPIIALSVTRASTISLLVIFISLVILQQTAISVVMIEQNWWPLYATPLTFSPFFLAGILAHRDDTRQRLSRLVMSLLLLTAVLGMSLVWSADVYRDRTVHILLTLSSCAAVWLAYRAAVPTALSRLSVLLGEISYALYLTHWFTNFFVDKVVTKLGASPSLKPWLFAVLAPLVAYASYRFWEAPTRSWVRKKFALEISSHPSNVSPPPAAAPINRGASTRDHR